VVAVKHVNMNSGGRSSWLAGELVAAKHGTADLTHLFADPLIEDEDLYLFLREGVKHTGGTLVMVADGRTPWDVYRDERFIGNNRAAPCSKLLKQKVCRRWVEQNCDPADTTLYVGIAWDEAHRVPDIRAAWAPWRVEFPLCEPPLLPMGEDAWKERLVAAGLKMPRLYEHGFPHNNCGGFCCRAGQAQFKRLLEVFPERYAWHERKEQELREYLEKDVSILRDRRGGETKSLTLVEFRERVEKGAPCDPFDAYWGGCGCFTEEDGK
jgi:hypothetical protein